MFGLNCLLTDAVHIKLIGEAMRDMSNTILEKNSDAKITVANLYNRIKKAGINIDKESAAYVYADVFANDINQYSNFETEDDLRTYSKIGREMRRLEDKKAKARENIQELQDKIDKNNLAIDKKTGLTDGELDDLRNQQKELLKELEQKRKEAKLGRYSDQSKLTAAEEAAEKNVQDLQERITNNDLEFQKEDSPTSAKLEQYRKMQKDLLKELDSKRRENGIGKYKVKKALMDAGYSKTTKDGKEILDWSQLMGKTEEDIKQEIRDLNLGNEQDIFDSLQDDWQKIIKTALDKAQNDLKNKNKDVTPSQKNAVDKIADLQARGLFDDFKDTYENAIRKSVGVSNNNITAMRALDNLGKVSALLANSPYGTSNLLGKILQSRANEVINKARYQDSNNFYKFAVGFAGLIDMVKLKVLANPINRGENYLSGKGGLLNNLLSNGLTHSEIKDLAFQYKRNMIRNGEDSDFGDVSNIWTGNNATAQKVRSWINKALTKDGESKFINWTYAQLMGTASLNGVDTYNKVINTWGRFISGMEDILVSKGETKKSAQKKLHQAIFGDVKTADGNMVSNWENARNKAKAAIQYFNNKSGSNIFKETEENIKIFADDIVKMELLNSGLVTSDELNAAWNAGYKSAGREMGHVANNAFSVGLNRFRDDTTASIDESVKEGNYTKAAFSILFDTAVNKIINAFVSGGTNWVILKTEKQGLGIVSAGLSRIREKQSFEKKKTLSNLSSNEIEEHLYNTQKTRDKFTRGVSGLITNGAISAIGIAALSAGGDDDEKQRRLKRFTAYMKDHYMLNRTFNKIAPLIISGYIAKLQQDQIGWEKLSSVLYGKKEPIVDFALNAVNKNLNYEGTTQILKSTSAFSDDSDKQIKGYGQIGKTTGSYLDLNPLPTKLIFDIKDISKEGVDIYNELTGKDVEKTPWTPEKYKTNWEATWKEYLKQAVIIPR